MIEPGKIKVGDRVKIHSGGPLMTVHRIYPATDTVWCRWFNVAGELQEREDFLLATLDLYEGIADPPHGRP